MQNLQITIKGLNQYSGNERGVVIEKRTKISPNGCYIYLHISKSNKLLGVDGVAIEPQFKMKVRPSGILARIAD